MFDGDPRSKIFLDHPFIKWFLSYSKFFVNLSTDSEQKSWYKYSGSRSEHCLHRMYNSFVIGCSYHTHLHFKSLLNHVKLVLHAHLSPQYWSVPSLLLGKNEIVHFPVFVFCCIISTCFCRFTLLANVRFQMSHI